MLDCSSDHNHALGSLENGFLHTDIKMTVCMFETHFHWSKGNNHPAQYIKPEILIFVNKCGGKQVSDFFTHFKSLS